MALFRHKQEIRADPVTSPSVDNALLQALIGNTSITKDVALQVPTIASSIDLISGIVAGTPIKLYKLDGDKVIEVKDDTRLALLNDDTGDTLNANQFWKAVVSDYYLGKGGYAYINKTKGKVASLHYVDETAISIQNNVDPIFKDYDILVNGKTYKPYDFIKILRNSKDGAKGTGIVTANSQIIEVAYESLKFESNLVKKGGNKKGFLKSAKKLTDVVMEALKTAWAKLYSNNSDNVVILNDGLEFIESSNTSVEMQLNENKATNSNELCKIFHISADVIAGKASDSDVASTAKLAAIPLMKTIECALNKDLLLEKEKRLFYWAFDAKELLKGNIKERYDAYGVGIDKGILMRSEARFAEDLPAADGLDVFIMGLGDVIYDPKTQMYFTPNTKTVTDVAGNTMPPPPPPIDGTITTVDVNAAAQELIGGDSGTTLKGGE